MSYMRRKRSNAKQRTISGYTRSDGVRVDSYSRKKRNDIRENRTVKRTLKSKVKSIPQKQAKTAWTKHLMETYEKLKKEDPQVKFSTAMKEAKKTYQK